MPVRWDSQGWWNTRAYTRCTGYPGGRGNRYRRQLRSCLNTQHWYHRVMDCRDQWSQVAGLQRESCKENILHFNKTLTCLSVTAGEWISDIALVTDTERDVISDTAVGIDTTEPRTGILTFSVDACFVWWTVRVNNTFWSTVGRSSNHLWQTGTVTSVTNLSRRIAVWSTRIWLTRIFFYDWCYR